MANPTPLSPAAQAVLDAAFGRWMEIDDIDDDIPGEIAAAALRAAADQVVSECCLEHQSNDSEWQTGFIDANCRIRAELLAIAAELGQVDLVRAALARWGTPNLTETRRSLTAAWVAHQPAIEAAAKAGMDACRQQPSDTLYVRFASLEWKLGCHMAEWKAARELAYRMGRAADELNQSYCDGVVQLLREYL